MSAIAPLGIEGSAAGEPARRQTSTAAPRKRRSATTHATRLPRRSNTPSSRPATTMCRFQTSATVSTQRHTRLCPSVAATNTPPATTASEERTNSIRVMY